MSKAMFLFINPDGCWHEWFGGPLYECRICGKETHKPIHPDYTDWKDFGPWWERLLKHKA